MSFTFLPPRENPHLIGHEKILEDIMTRWTCGTMPHALMLYGPKGIGKATLAYHIARFVLYQGLTSQGEEQGLLLEDPAPNEGFFIPKQSATFRKIAQGGHPNLFTLENDEQEGAGKGHSIGVGDVRKLTKKFQVTPAESLWRVALIDGADQMNWASQNALLKLLEEPPAHSLIILVVHAQGKILPTIRSRCVKMAVSGLNDAEMAFLMKTFSLTVEAPLKMEVLTLAQGRFGLLARLATPQGQDCLAIIHRVFEGTSPPSFDELKEFANFIGKTEENFHLFDSMFMAKFDAFLKAWVIKGVSLPKTKFKQIDWFAFRDWLIDFLAKGGLPSSLDRKQIALGVLLRFYGLKKEGAF